MDVRETKVDKKELASVWLGLSSIKSLGKRVMSLRKPDLATCLNTTPCSWLLAMSSSGNENGEQLTRFSCLKLHVS